MSMIKNNKEVILLSAKDQKQVIHIQYSIIFQGSLTQVGQASGPVLALLNLGSKVNVIYPAFIEKLGFAI